MLTTEDFIYKTEFSRRRTLSIIVSPDKGVVIKAPLRTTSSVINRFVISKSYWIRKALESFNTLRRIDSNDGYSNGDIILLFGKEYIVNLIYSTDRYAGLGVNNTIEVLHPEKDNPLIVRSMLEAWFYSIARLKLTEKFREILLKYKDYNFSPTGFTVRKMKKRWGSCSSKGKIAISYDLIRLDEVFTEYVIIHELCHLRHHNHSTNYYLLLTEVYPGWKRTREALRKYIR